MGIIKSYGLNEVYTFILFFPKAHCLKRLGFAIVAMPLAFWGGGEGLMVMVMVEPGQLVPLHSPWKGTTPEAILTVWVVCACLNWTQKSN